MLEFYIGPKCNLSVHETLAQSQFAVGCLVHETLCSGFWWVCRRQDWISARIISWMSKTLHHTLLLSTQDKPEDCAPDYKDNHTLSPLGIKVFSIKFLNEGKTTVWSCSFHVLTLLLYWGTLAESCCRGQNQLTACFDRWPKCAQRGIFYCHFDHPEQYKTMLLPVKNSLWPVNVLTTRKVWLLCELDRPWEVYQHFDWFWRLH